MAVKNVKFIRKTFIYYFFETQQHIKKYFANYIFIVVNKRWFLQTDKTSKQGDILVIIEAMSVD